MSHYEVNVNAMNTHSRPEAVKALHPCSTLSLRIRDWYCNYAGDEKIWKNLIFTMIIEFS